MRLSNDILEFLGCPNRQRESYDLIVAQLKLVLGNQKEQLDNQKRIIKLMGDIDTRLTGVEAGLDEAAQEILAELAKLRGEVVSDEDLATLGRIETKVTALTNVSPPIEQPV